MPIASVIWCGDSRKQCAERRFGDVLAEDDAEEHQRDADDRRFLDVPLAPHEHVEAHEHRDRDGRADRERAPGAFGQRVDDGEAEAGERDDQDEEDGDGGGGAGDRCRFRCARSRPASGRRGASTPTARSKSCTAPARQQPASSQMKPGRLAELRREHRAEQRAGAGDRGEVMAEEHPARASGSSWRRRTSYAPASCASRRATITFAAMNAL